MFLSMKKMTAFMMGILKVIMPLSSSGILLWHKCSALTNKVYIYINMHMNGTRLLESVWKKSNCKFLFYLRYSLLVLGTETRQYA